MRWISQNLNFKDVNPLIAFFNFLPCHKKVHYNKEFSHGNSKLCCELNHNLLSQTMETMFIWQTSSQKNSRLFLFQVTWTTCSKRLCQTSYYDFSWYFLDHIAKEHFSFIENLHPITCINFRIRQDLAEFSLFTFLLVSSFSAVPRCILLPFDWYGQPN